MKEITSKQIFETGHLLTLNAAEKLVGSKIAITSPVSNENIADVKIFTIKGFISEWDAAALDKNGIKDYGSRQEWWESYMKKERIEELKKTLLIETESDLVESYWKNVGVRCHTYNTIFSEPTFTGSDIDREVYYVVLNNEN